MKISLIGYGYMAKRVLNRLLQSPQAASLHISTLSRSEVQHANATRHICVDLDNIPQESAASLAACEKSALLYFTPPPRKGQKDTRIREFLAHLEKAQAIPTKFVLISTTGVYGDCQGKWIDESQVLAPTVDRALRRADAELATREFCATHNRDVTILRVAGIYAEDKLPLARLKRQEPIIAAEQSPYSNRIHAADLAQICLQALLERHPGVFNCADNEPSTMSDYFSRLASALELPQPPIISQEEALSQLSSGMLSYLQESRQINNQKLIEEFKLQLQYPSLESFLQTLK